MSKKRLIGLSALGISIYLAAGYLDSQNTLGYEELLKALESCGTFIQSGFKSTQRGQSDYFVVLISILVVIATLVYSIKYLIWPNEGIDHIKHQIIKQEHDGKND